MHWCIYLPIAVCPYAGEKWMAMNWKQYTSLANAFGFISDVNIWKWISEGLRESMVFKLNFGSMGDRMMSTFLDMHGTRWQFNDDIFTLLISAKKY